MDGLKRPPWREGPRSSETALGESCKGPAGWCTSHNWWTPSWRLLLVADVSTGFKELVEGPDASAERSSRTDTRLTSPTEFLTRPHKCQRACPATCGKDVQGIVKVGCALKSPRTELHQRMRALVCQAHSPARRVREFVFLQFFALTWRRRGSSTGNARAPCQP